MGKFFRFLCVSTALLAVIMMSFVTAAMAEEDESELAKKTQNSVSDLISVPFQNNWNFGVGPHDKTQYVLNIQPVWPVSLNEDWNLITRTIVPVISQPGLALAWTARTGWATSTSRRFCLRQSQAN